VDSPLNLFRSPLYCRDRVCDRQIRIVVSMNTEPCLYRLGYLANYFGEPARERPAVGIAEHDPVRAGSLGGQQCFESIDRVSAKAVEEMLRIIDHLTTLRFQVGDRIRDQLEVPLKWDSQRFGDVQIPGLTEDSHHGCLGF